ncbi:programmed cell death protein 2 [Pisolithus albus]|nr:programmed cell death protein 2 [Pisolithus albus]
MPIRAEDEDWSDSDDEALSSVETDVLLGVPDGRVESDNDLRDAAVSRIGGLPALLPSREPPFPSSQCKNCSSPMKLLVQIWCPFENSPMDRALYIWGCARASCQRQPGSVRAWRALRYNADYAAKLEKRKLARTHRHRLRVLSPSTTQTHFLCGACSSFDKMQALAAPSPFNLGDQIFGQSSSSPFEPPPAAEVNKDHDQSDDESEASSTEDSLITAMASTTIQESPWTAAPSYPPIYLSTMAEYIPPAPKAKLPDNARMEDSADDDKGGKDGAWGLEAYENTLKVDLVFERFTKRISHTADQCLRYELKGTPLPFASDKVFEVLFPAPPQDPLPVTGAAFKVVSPVKRSYNASSIPHCSVCKSSRAFECQLMPNLINVVRAAAKDKDVDDRKLTDAERIKAVQAVLKSNQATGMEWGTCMVFSCEKDCCLDEGGKDATECWREEHVLVQWDD